MSTEADLALGELAGPPVLDPLVKTLVKVYVKYLYI